jgi:hypothetical protein
MKILEIISIVLVLFASGFISGVWWAKYKFREDEDFRETWGNW